MMIQTTHGPIEGKKEQGLWAFLGIPYGKAPVGELRWKAPLPADEWKEVRDATHYGPRAVQRHEQRYHDQAVYSEDCLNLCVWTPSCDEKRRPVVVYIHGGGHFEGSNSDVPFDGPHLIGKREAVMVSINYRLGILGYLDLSSFLGDEYQCSGNCGLLDQILALKWVQENIAAFGGNPDNVTVMGQSAGGKSVAHLMMTPLAKGLFHKAVIQSGGAQCIRDRQTASVIARYHMNALFSQKPTKEQLLSLSVDKLLAAQAEISDHFVAPWHAYGPVQDGIVFSAEAYLADCPTLIGYTSEELYYSKLDESVNENTIFQKLQWNFGSNAPAAYRCRQHWKEEAPSRALGRTMTHCVYHAGGDDMIRRLVGYGNRTYVYLWDYHGTDTPHHFSEMRFLFRYPASEVPDGYAPGEEKMAEKVNQAFLDFIFTGEAPTPEWQPCQSNSSVRMRITENGWHMENYLALTTESDFPECVICF